MLSQGHGDQILTHRMVAHIIIIIITPPGLLPILSKLAIDMFSPLLFL
jgi:hypothetical protein